MKGAKMRNERGNVLVTAILITVSMMMLGLAAASVVDNQTSQSRKERERESTFNLTEGVLTSQTYVLGRLGTGSDVKQFPNKCLKGSTNDLCPSTAELNTAFNTGSGQVDFAAGTTWETSVRDNQEPSGAFSEFYHPSLTDSDCAASATDHIWCYDQNNDDQMWVRATSTVRNRTRTIVALIRVERRPIAFPRYAVLAGGFQTSNNGNKVIIDATGSLGVGVRCSFTPPATGPTPGDPCLSYDPAKGQLVPAGAYTMGHAVQPAVIEDDIVALEDAAKAAGTWFATCPANPSGSIVYVKSGNCSYTGDPGEINSNGNPGVFIIENGTFTTQRDFYGIIYALNKQNSTDFVVTTQGNGVIYGGALVDGHGKVLAGSDKENVMFRATAFNNAAAAGTAGVVQNTWRELPAD
jgi:type II secretory pathway pseudopilin PulG